MSGPSAAKRKKSRNENMSKPSLDVTTRLAQLQNFRDLHSVIPDTIESLSSNPVCCVVYLHDVVQEELFADRENTKRFPKLGLLWAAWQTQKEQRRTEISPKDPIVVLLKECNTSDANWEPKNVICLPVIYKEEKTVIAVIGVCHISGNEVDRKILSFIEKQILACYRRMCKCNGSAVEYTVGDQDSTSTTTGQSDKEAIIKLCGELYDQDATILQLKVLKYLEEQTRAEYAFLLLVVPETQDMFCQVVGNKVLDSEVRFQGQNSCFSVALETKEPIQLQDIPLDKRKTLEEELGIKHLESFLCVPVTSRNSDNLIALACVVNKKNNEKFNSNDVYAIRQCFQYTATVLTSTLAFQNERKLKIQTQAMLQVARNLFQHLGEFSLEHGECPYGHPDIRCGQFVVDVVGHTFADFLKIGKPSLFAHSRPFVGAHFNNSARIDTDTSVKEQLQKQEQIADQLTGIHRDNRKISPEKYKVKPRLKSPDSKKPKPNHLTYETKERYFQGDIDTSEIIQPFVAVVKPDEVLDKETENVNSSEENRGKKKTKRDLEIQLSELDEHVKKEFPSELVKMVAVSKQDENVKPQNVGVATEMSVVSETNESSMTFVDLPNESAKEGIVSEEEPFSTPVSDTTNWMSPVSYKTAEDSVSEMVTAVESSSVENDVSFNTDEAGNTDIEDLFEVTDTSLNTSRSDTFIIEDLYESKMFQSQEQFTMPRISNSLPEMSSTTLHGDSDSYIDSKPELNYAFLENDFKSFNEKEKSTDFSDVEFYSPCSDVPKGTDKNKREHSDASSNIEYLSCVDVNVDNHQMTLCDSHTIVIDDTDSKQQLTMSLHHIEPCHLSSSLTITPSEHYPESQSLVLISDQCVCQQVSLTEAVPVHIPNDLTKLLREIMQEARNLTQAERCSVFLIDTETEELVAKVFDGITTDSNEVQTEIRMPITQGIAGHVATTGELLNIKDAYSHPLFYRGIDDSTGFRTRNILCFPIKDEKGVVMGVAQLCNKKTAHCFTQFDEDVASAFAVYCCISISHCLMYKKLQDSQHRNRLANELMIYHMQVSPEDVYSLSQADIPSPQHWSVNFDMFYFPPREITDNDTALTCLTMFEDLGFISRFRIKRDTLVRFVLMVKRGYRSPPYHNWMHAFSVAHFCYLCIKNCKLSQQLEDIELFALFVSCLCHDIDHRGTTNSFQTSSKSVLAALYSSEGSVLERHHFAQTMCIMNTEGCNIFENLSSKDYQKGLDLVRDIILATDLAHHFKILGNLHSMAKDGYDKTSDKNHKLLLCLLMTAADLSDQTKPWDKTKHIAELIYREFFSQGDLEKSLGKEPPEMMDRERARIPKLQISFLDDIALPVYKILNNLFPQAEPVRQVVEDNRRHWEKICGLIEMKRGGSCEKMSYDQILALEEEELENAEPGTHYEQNGS